MSSFYIYADIPTDIRNEIAAWVLEQKWPEGTQFIRPSRYHITLAYVEEGDYNVVLNDYDKFLSGWHFRCFGGGDELELFTDGLGRPIKPAVIKLRADMLKDSALDLQRELRKSGCKISTYSEDFKPHISVARVPDSVESLDLVTPDLYFRTLSAAKIADRNGDLRRKIAKA